MVPGTWRRHGVSSAAGCGFGTSTQLDGAGRRARRDLEQPVGQVARRDRGEPVEAAVGPVLGQVPTAVAGERRRFVCERAHRGASTRRLRARRVALPHVAPVPLLAGEPGAPRGGATGAVLRGVGADRSGAHHGAVRGEADRADPAAPAGHLVVDRQVPAARDRGVDEGRRAIGEDAVAEARPRHRLAAAGDDPAGEPGVQPHAVRIDTGPRRRRRGARLGDRRGDRHDPCAPRPSQHRAARHPLRARASFRPVVQAPVHEMDGT